MSETVPAIDVHGAAAALQGGALLFDVREPDEHATVRAVAANLVPLATVPDRLDTFPVGQTFYVICAAGGRSARAVEWLRANGRDAVNVAGGTNAWVAAGLATESGEPSPSGA